MAPFEFVSHTIASDLRTIVFNYRLEGDQYSQTVILPTPIDLSKRTPLLDQILHNLHIALGISYWKATCSPAIKILWGTLTKSEANFWNSIYTHGLGEFYYRNNIDFRNLVNFPYAEETRTLQPVKLPPHNRELIGIGGGKDSVVVWERFKRSNKNIMGLVIHTQHRHAIIDDLTVKMNIPHIGVERSLDERFFNSLQTWKYNGHVPVSMIYAWIGILVAYLFNYDSFVVSNEKSAEEANTELFGMHVNHQWSKTQEFESLFNEYIHSHITPSINYYSPLRQMSELQIVEELVTKYPQYLPHIASCNRNFSILNPLKDRKWCGKCPKCAFAFLMLSAYLPKQKVIDLFGKNMLEDPSLASLFFDLGGRGGLKPFECVGTFAEVQDALKMIVVKGEFIIPEDLVMNQ